MSTTYQDIEDAFSKSMNPNYEAVSTGGLI